jgi:hypothetical protein
MQATSVHEFQNDAENAESTLVDSTTEPERDNGQEEEPSESDDGEKEQREAEESSGEKP